MESQESRPSDKTSGSDLDIFEALGKKADAEKPEKPAVPPPPGSSAHVPPGARTISGEMKKTLLGIPGPAAAMAPMSSAPAIPSSRPSPPMIRPQSAPPPPGSVRYLAPPATVSQPTISQPPLSKPAAPPSRGSLPPVTASAPATQRVPTSAAPTAPGSPTTQRTLGTTPPSQNPSSQAAAPTESSRKLDMEWDDEDEATHVFDKEGRDSTRIVAAPTEALEAMKEPKVGPESRPPEHADMDAIMSSPPRTSSMPPQPQLSLATAEPAPEPTSSLSGQFASLGTKNQSPPPASNAFRVAPPPNSQAFRATPPPPPVSAKGGLVSAPPPPPPGQVTTAPMHMPPTRPLSTPPQGHIPTLASAQAPAISNYPPSGPVQSASTASMPQMPPVSRAMEATALVPRPQPASRAGLWVALLLGVFAAVGLAVFFLMPRSGTLVVNVADTKGGAVSKLEVLVDGTRKCESAPCILKDIPAGVHEIKVSAQGFDAPAPRAVTIESSKSATLEFPLQLSKVGGTGIKVTGSQPSVKLFVDAKEIGALPQEIRDLAAGEHKIRFAGSDRYAPLEKTISVGDNEVVDLGNVALKVLKGKATIQLGTPGAKVYLVSGSNRKEVPQFPIAIDFDPNEKWELQATKDGFESYSQPISFEDGLAEKTITVTLSPKGMNLSAAPSRPAFTPPAAAAAAPAAKKEPAADKEPAAAKEPAPKKEAPAAAAGGEAFLNINSLPASSVVLDGKPLGPTPRVHVSVPAGAHTITFINAEQSLKKTITVNVGAGETKAAFAKLRTE